MQKVVVSCSIDREAVNELDAKAEARDRSRSYLINEAVTEYLDQEDEDE